MIRIHTRLLFRMFFVAILLPVQEAHPFAEYPYAVEFLNFRTPILPAASPSYEKSNQIIRLNMRWINVWSYQFNRFIVDGEEFQVEPSFSWKLSSRTSATGSIPLKLQGGGFLDSSIEWFHSATNVTQTHRDRFSRDRFNVSYEPLGKYYPFLDGNIVTTYLRQIEDISYPRDAATILLDANFPELSRNSAAGKPGEFIAVSGYNRSGPGNPLFTVTHKLPDSLLGPGGWTVGASIRPPLFGSKTHFRHSGMATSLFLVHEYRWNLPELFLIQVGVSYTAFEKTNFWFLKLPSSQVALRSSANLQMDPDLFVSLEYVYTGSSVKNMGHLSDPGHQVALSFQQVWNQSKITFGFVEDMIAYHSTPDIGFFATIEITNLTELAD